MVIINIFKDSYSIFEIDFFDLNYKIICTNTYLKIFYNNESIFGFNFVDKINETLLDKNQIKKIAEDFLDLNKGIYFTGEFSEIFSERIEYILNVKIKK